MHCVHAVPWRWTGPEREVARPHSFEPGLGDKYQIKLYVFRVIQDVAVPCNWRFLCSLLEKVSKCNNHHYHIYQMKRYRTWCDKEYVVFYMGLPFSASAKLLWRSADVYFEHIFGTLNQLSIYCAISKAIWFIQNFRCTNFEHVRGYKT